MDPFVEKIVERTHARQLALEKKAEQIGQEKMGMIRQPMKRLRDLQSESGDNKEEVHSVSQDSSKRCCYEVVGDENLNPKEKMLSPSKSCRRFAEMEVKPDTPALISVKTRMNKLATLRRQWDSQDDADCPSPVYSSSHTPAALQVKLVSKPVVSKGRIGRLADLASAIGSWEDDFSTPSKKFNTGKELLVESVVQPVLEFPSKHEDYEDIQGLPDEGNEDSELQLRHSVTDSNAFRSVLEKFESNPRQVEPSPASHRPRSLSSSTRAIQERLLNDTTPSLSMASLLRKEREEELSLVRMQPNKENLWLRKNGAGSGFRETIGVVSGVTRIIKRIKRNQWPPNILLYPVAETEESKVGKQETLDSSSKYHLNQSVDKVEVSSIEVKLCSFSGESLLISEDGVDPAGEVEKEELTEKGFRSLKKVTFAPETVIHLPCVKLDSQESEMEEVDTVLGEELSSQEEEINSSEVIDQIFEGLLDDDEEVEETDKDVEMKMKEVTEIESREGSMETQPESKEESLETEKIVISEQDQQEGNMLTEMKESEEWNNVDEKDDELTIPTSILSPLAKSVEAIVTPMRLVLCDLAEPIPFFQDLGQESDAHPAEETAPMYSIDAYRTLRRSAAYQSVTPVNRRKAFERALGSLSLNVKEKIKMLNGEIGTLQTIIQQASQALNCCTDEEHGKGSLEEAEAEKLLLVSSEKRLSLLSELSHLKGMGSQQQGTEPSTKEPCRGTLSISNLRLPLNVEFVSSALAKTGKPSHYFFVLIRYGSSNIVSTPLATAVDAQKGDTIAFPTSITLQDIHSNFEIDVEVYSLAKMGHSLTFEKRRPSKSKVTPKKLLTSMTKSSNNSPANIPAVTNTVRTSNFSLVGSHKITLASLGRNKFLLDKIKFDGKVRQLLGDEFQEKVPFLSPLEGNIHLRLECQIHSTIEHKGFLTMFEDVHGFGAWHRRWFSFNGKCVSYWNYPDDEGSKEAIGCINLTNCTSKEVESVKRDSCARPNTFELITARPQQKDNRKTVSQVHNTVFFKSWFSADTKEERAEWMEKLNQALLNLRTWQPVLSDQRPQQGRQDGSSFSSSRESVL
ncbi:anillin-like isoform X2 [Acipenser ruthenus]|uniref:anillin-like isoform X2 n=1 Tax=Acipenser ruthenus TaxID=7906 RepID=UPI0027416663|nr:anillin-like isoform X2 [Acipenser ruthenus]